MPVATPQQFKHMLKSAQEGHYAYPAVNCTSLVTINAALKGFADKKSDGIIQFSTGAGQFASGTNNKDAVYGVKVLAELTHMLAEQYNILVALNTDHCPPNQAENFLFPLIQETAKRRTQGKNNLFQNHMLDASNLPLEENMTLSKKYLQMCAENEIILEVEAGIVGGEEDGAAGSMDTPASKLYTTPEDMVAVYEALNPIGKFTFAATFGNVHGHYKPGTVKLRPEILKQGQEAVTKKYGQQSRFDLVFHGGSGSPEEKIKETLQYGVIKMNIDTDTQYTFTRALADHMFKNYDGVMMIDGEIGNKKVYDPRTYSKKAEESMAKRISIACDDLESSEKTLFEKI
jgi:fructose-bisphosphate aldolase, class II